MNTLNERNNTTPQHAQEPGMLAQLIPVMLDLLAELCHKQAYDAGFHSDHEEASIALSKATGDSSRLLNWLSVTTEQAEIARMHSELSEWLEGVRKGNQPDEHLPHLSSAEVEAADCIIRILDTCGKRNYRIGLAVRDKLEYNRSRPRMHGKNS